MYQCYIKLKINSETNYIDEKVGKIVDTVHVTFKNRVNVCNCMSIVKILNKI